MVKKRRKKKMLFISSSKLKLCDTINWQPNQHYYLCCSLLFIITLFTITSLQPPGPVSIGEALLLQTSPYRCLGAKIACNCSWRSGKFMADCGSGDFKRVPNNDYYDHLLANGGDNQMPTLNRDIQALNLSSNKIQHLEDNEFSLKKFRNLQRLHLSSNDLSEIQGTSFARLTGLIELDLSSNRLEGLIAHPARRTNNHSSPTRDTADHVGDQDEQQHPSSFLNELTNLRQLNLAENLIRRLEARAFLALGQLRQLFLSRNQIAFVHPNAFQGLKLLNILHLDDNKLATLDGRLMTQLPALHSIRLGGSNEWRCDCHLRSLVRALAAFGLGLGATSGGGSGAGGFLTSQRGASTGPAPATHAVTTDNRANRPMVMTMLELQAAAPLQLQLLQSSLVVGSLSLLEDEPECHMRATSFKPVQQHQQSENNSLATKNNMNPNEPIDSLWVSTQQRKQTWGNMTIGQFQCQPKLAPVNRRRWLNKDQHQPDQRNQAASSGSSLVQPPRAKPAVTFMNNNQLQAPNPSISSHSAFESWNKSSSFSTYSPTSSSSSYQQQNQFPIRDPNPAPVASMEDSKATHLNPPASSLHDSPMNASNNQPTAATTTTQLLVNAIKLDNDKQQSQKNNNNFVTTQGAGSSFFLQEKSHSRSLPIQFTCPIGLFDELDLELNTIDWFVGRKYHPKLSSKATPRWHLNYSTTMAASRRSNHDGEPAGQTTTKASHQQSQMTRQFNDYDNQNDNDQFMMWIKWPSKSMPTIIDYVTRLAWPTVNGGIAEENRPYVPSSYSESRADFRVSSGSKGETDTQFDTDTKYKNESYNIDSKQQQRIINDDGDSLIKFVRMVHLILDPAQISMLINDKRLLFSNERSYFNSDSDPGGRPVSQSSSSFNGPDRRGLGPKTAIDHDQAYQHSNDLDHNEPDDDESQDVKDDIPSPNSAGELDDNHDHDNKGSQFFFVCRVTNKRGQVDLVQGIQFHQSTIEASSSSLDHETSYEQKSQGSISKTNIDFSGRDPPPSVLIAATKQQQNNNKMTSDLGSIEEAKLALQRELIQLQLKSEQEPEKKNNHQDRENHNNETFPISSMSNSISSLLNVDGYGNTGTIFIPIQIPSWILVTNGGEPNSSQIVSLDQLASTGAMSSSQANPIAGQPAFLSQRPAIRQTNGTNKPPTQVNGSVANSMILDRQLNQRLVRSLAWSLIEQYTSQSHWLGIGEPHSAWHRQQSRVGDNADDDYDHDQLLGPSSNVGIDGQYRGDQSGGHDSNTNQQQDDVWLVNRLVKSNWWNSIWLRFKMLFHHNNHDHRLDPGSPRTRPQFAIGHVPTLVMVATSCLLVATSLSLAIFVMMRACKRRTGACNSSNTNNNNTKKNGDNNTLVSSSRKGSSQSTTKEHENKKHQSSSLINCSPGLSLATSSPASSAGSFANTDVILGTRPSVQATSPSENLEQEHPMTTRCHHHHHLNSPDPLSGYSDRPQSSINNLNGGVSAYDCNQYYGQCTSYNYQQQHSREDLTQLQTATCPESGSSVITNETSSCSMASSRRKLIKTTTTTGQRRPNTNIDNTEEHPEQHNKKEKHCLMMEPLLLDPSGLQYQHRRPSWATSSQIMMHNSSSGSGISRADINRLNLTMTRVNDSPGHIHPFNYLHNPTSDSQQGETGSFPFVQHTTSFNTGDDVSKSMNQQQHQGLIYQGSTINYSDTSGYGSWMEKNTRQTSDLASTETMTPNNLQQQESQAMFLIQDPPEPRLFNHSNSVMQLEVDPSQWNNKHQNYSSLHRTSANHLHKIHPVQTSFMVQDQFLRTTQHKTSLPRTSTNHRNQIHNGTQIIDVINTNQHSIGSPAPSSNTSAGTNRLEFY